MICEFEKKISQRSSVAITELMNHCYGNQMAVFCLKEVSLRKFIIITLYFKLEGKNIEPMTYKEINVIELRM